MVDYFEPYQDDDNDDKRQLSFIATESLGYVIIITIFALIVLLVCVTGLTISCLCRGREVVLNSRYSQNKYVVGISQA